MIKKSWFVKIEMDVANLMAEIVKLKTQDSQTNGNG